MQLMTIPILSRATDPITSDVAAEKQLKKLNDSHAAVLELFKENDALSDTELNHLYHSVWCERDFPQLSFDTPRRRRSDLAGRHYLEKTAVTRVNDNGGTEKVWQLAAPVGAEQLALDFESVAA